MPDTVRSLLEAATGLPLDDFGAVHVELPGPLTVGDPASPLGLAVAQIYPGVAIPADAVLVLETDSLDLDAAVIVPGTVTVDAFDGSAGSAPSPAIWAVVNGVTLDGSGNAVFDQATAHATGLTLASSEPLDAQAWRAELAQVGNAGSGLRAFTLAATRLNDPRYGLSMVQAGGGLQCRVQDPSHGSTQLAAPAWNATTMRHWRIRRSGALAVFETSPDGVAWTQRASVADPGWLDEPCRYTLSNTVSAGGANSVPVKVAAVALG